MKIPLRVAVVATREASGVVHISASGWNEAEDHEIFEAALCTLDIECGDEVKRWILTADLDVPDAPAVEEIAAKVEDA